MDRLLLGWIGAPVVHGVHGHDLRRQVNDLGAESFGEILIPFLGRRRLHDARDRGDDLGHRFHLRERIGHLVLCRLLREQ